MVPMVTTALPAATAAPTHASTVGPEPERIVAPATPTPVVPYGAGGWTYLTGAQGLEPTFHEVGFNDAAWSHVGVAPIGSAGGCPVASGLATPWPVNSDLLLRRAKGARPSRDRHRRPRHHRAQRGVRLPVDRGHRRPRHRPGEGHERRRHRPGPPARDERRPPDHDGDPRAASDRRPLRPRHDVHRRRAGHRDDRRTRGGLIGGSNGGIDRHDTHGGRTAGR